MWNQIVEHAVDWAPTVVTCGIGIVVVAGADRVLQHRHKARKETHAGILAPLMTFSLVGITLVAVTLTLPIGEAARGQLLGLLGLLVTAAVALSSTTVLGNAMAGIMLRAIRAFRPGDFVRVGEHVGRVSDQGILHTEIQTEDRDLTTLPNLYLVTHPLRVMRSSGTVVSATISLGYDIAHQEIEKHLLVAADRAGLSDPFVQVLELGDDAITYRTAGFLTDIKQLLSTRSNLRKAMLDTLHEAKIEIVSPRFLNLRSIREQDTVLPEPAKIKRKHQVQDPEARIFDKADAAEAKDRMIGEREALAQNCAELDAKIAESSFEAEKDDLERQRQTIVSRLASLDQFIENES